MFLQKLLSGKNEVPVTHTTEQPTATKSRSTRIPQTEITEADDHFALALSMPGVARDRVEITVKHNMLTIRGELPGAQTNGFQLIHQEYPESDFLHSFTLPNEVDREAIAATTRHGVLLVKLPKAKAAQPRQIPVSAK
jgi:HSP20 family protein